MTRFLIVFGISLLLVSGCGDEQVAPANNGDNNEFDMGPDSRADMNVPDAADNALASVTITPNPAELDIDTTQRLTLTAETQSGGFYPRVGVVWTIDDAAVAEVTADGVLIGKSGGATIVRATLDGVEGSADVKVKGLPVDRVEVRPATATLLIGDTSQITVDLFDSQNAPILDARPTTYTSSMPTLASVSGSGLVTAISPGLVTVQIETEGKTGEVIYTIPDVQVDTIDISPKNQTIVWGVTLEMSAPLTYTGPPPTNEPEITWSSSDVTTVSINASGDATALKAGTVTITARAGGKSASTDLSVDTAFSAIATGRAHTCGLIQGSAVCWGYNPSDQLGHANGNTVGRVRTDLRFQTLAVGGRHTCGIEASVGGVHCWGAGDLGQLGHGMFGSVRFPVPLDLPDNTGFTGLSLGEDHSCASKSGQLYCWGKGADGRLGTGNFADAISPILIGNFTKPSAGKSHTCAINAQDEAFCWGENASGQLGINTFVVKSSPTAVLGGYEYASLYLGESHSCGVTTGNALTCWGSNDRNQVGDGTDTVRATPILASSTTALTRIAAGSNHTCGLSAAGALFCWGAYDRGALAQNVTADVTTPTSSNISTTFFAIGSGDAYSCALATGGIPYCWGAGDLGQLGGTADSAVPLRIAPF